MEYKYFAIQAVNAAGEVVKNLGISCEFQIEYRLEAHRAELAEGQTLKLTEVFRTRSNKYAISAK